MSAETYRLVHFVGVLMLFLGVGGMLACMTSDGKRAPAMFTVLHGLGLLVVLVAGVGRAHALGLGFPGWMWLKVGCWLALGLLPLLARRAGLPRAFALLLTLGFGFAAFWIVKNPHVI